MPICSSSFITFIFCFRGNSKEDAAEPSNCYIKSLLLQPRVALWVGTAGGHLIIIDTNTHQLVSISKRYTSNLRAMVAVKGHGELRLNALPS